MFRRKPEEDSLFDSLEPQARPQGPNAFEGTAQQAPAPANSAYAHNTNAAFPVARPVPISTATTQPQAPSYRPTPVDISRARPTPVESTRPQPAPQAAPAAAPSISAPAADKHAPAKPNRRVLTVGNDILLKGEITNCDRLLVEGRVDATIKDVHTVEIAEMGSFKGFAEVEEAEVSGNFEGDLHVRGRLVIYATGKVRGKVTYGEIEIQRGGELAGEIKTGSEAQASPRRNADMPARHKEAA